MAPCPSHSRARVSQEPFPRRPERHRPRHTFKHPSEGEVGGVNAPWNTGEEQLLHLAVPTWRQRKKESSSAVPSWTDTHCVLSYTRKGSSPENAGSVKLINVLKLDVAQKSPPIVDGSQSRTANVSSNVLMAAPNQDAMPHIRFRLVARQHGEQPQTATHHTKGVWMRHGTDHTANNVDICSKPFKKARALSP